MDGDIDGADVRKLTRGDAVFLYNRHFWQPLGCDALPMPLGEALFDQGVNGGPDGRAQAAAARHQQLPAAHPRLKPPKTLLKVDGNVGPATMAALREVATSNSVGMPAWSPRTARRRASGTATSWCAIPTRSAFSTAGWRADALGK
jgi:lysozyme family protein